MPNGRLGSPAPPELASEQLTELAECIGASVSMFQSWPNWSTGSGLAGLGWPGWPACNWAGGVTGLGERPGTGLASRTASATEI